MEKKQFEKSTYSPYYTWRLPVIKNCRNLPDGVRIGLNIVGCLGWSENSGYFNLQTDTAAFLMYIIDHAFVLLHCGSDLWLGLGNAAQRFPVDSGVTTNLHKITGYQSIFQQTPLYFLRQDNRSYSGVWLAFDELMETGRGGWVVISSINHADNIEPYNWYMYTKQPQVMWN